MSMRTKTKKIFIALAIVIPTLLSCLLAGNLYYIKTNPESIPELLKENRAEIRSGVLANINKYRSDAGLEPVKPSLQLTASSVLKAVRLIDFNIFEHGDLVGEFMIVGVDRTNCKKLGENLSVDYYTANTITTAWFNSPTHRAEMLDPTFNYLGLGISEDDDDFIVAAHFASCTNPIP